MSYGGISDACLEQAGHPRGPIREFGLFQSEGSGFDWSASDLLSDFEFENLVQIRLTNSQSASEAGEAMAQRIERILALLESELQS
jgi:hypothetical protein